jgi:outer membrane receptor protein involved in Fe transport
VTGAPFGSTQNPAVEPEADHYNAYLYATGRLAETLSVTLGVSYDDLDTGVGFTKSSWNPKFGVSWRPADGMTLRAAAFQTLKRPFAANQTIEPTQVAGFNQFFDDATATEAQRIAGGADARLGRNAFAGAVVSRRKLDAVPFLNAATAQPSRFVDFDERHHRAYLAWLPARQWALSLQYWFDSQSREIPAGFTDNLPREVKTQLFPAALDYHAAQGWFFRLVATAFHQNVEFLTGTPASQRESTWIADALFGYRLPRRLGTLSLETKNLFDTNFNIFDTDMLGTPKVPVLLPARSVFLQLRLVI